MKGKEILNIKKVKNELYEVSFDDDTFLEVDEDVVIYHRLVVNKIISDTLFLEIEKSVTFFTFYKKALNYAIKYCPFKYKLQTYLKKQECPGDIINQIMDKLEDLKILNDNLYAINYTNSLINKAYGRFYINLKLKSMEFSDETIKEAISRIDNNLYIEALNKLYMKQMKSYKKYDDYTCKIKIKNYLINRGYEIDLINDLIKTNS